MAKRGAKSKYETLCRPYLKEINEKVRQGVTEAAIANALGISVASLNNYRNKYPEFAEALSKDKGADVLQALLNAGVEAAIGCYITNEQTIFTIDENGNRVPEKVIQNKVWQPPNPALNKFYVQNYGKEQGYAADPLQYELKKRKQDFEEKLEKAKNWHLKI